MKLFKLVAALAMACLLLSVAGCTSLSQSISTAETVYQQVKNYYTDAPKAVYTLKGGFIIVQSAVANFKTTECPSVTSHPYCATLIPKLRSYNKAAETAIDTAKTFVLANPTLDASVLYNAAVQATEAFANFATQNGVPAS